MLLGDGDDERLRNDLGDGRLRELLVDQGEAFEFVPSQVVQHEPGVPGRGRVDRHHPLEVGVEVLRFARVALERVEGVREEKEGGGGEKTR